MYWSLGHPLTTLFWPINGHLSPTRYPVALLWCGLCIRFTFHTLISHDKGQQGTNRLLERHMLLLHKPSDEITMQGNNEAEGWLLIIPRRVSSAGRMCCSPALKSYERPHAAASATRERVDGVRHVEVFLPDTLCRLESASPLLVVVLVGALLSTPPSRGRRWLTDTC